jgi:hypothetical protein
MFKRKMGLVSMFLALTVVTAACGNDTATQSETTATTQIESTTSGSTSDTTSDTTSDADSGATENGEEDSDAGHGEAPPEGGGHDRRPPGSDSESGEDLMPPESADGVSGATESTNP